MYALYLISLIPALTGLILFLANKRIHWIEWLVASLAGLICSGIIHGCVIHGMIADVETWSGKLTKAIYEPKWVEEYQKQHEVKHYNSKGEYSYSTYYYTIEHRTHGPNWTAYGDFGFEVKSSWDITTQRFDEIQKNFGGITIETPHKKGFDSGNPNIYVAYNKNEYVSPVTILRHFENKLKAAPTLLSYPKVLKGTPVFDYPENKDPFQSNRLQGLAMSHFDINLFDQMNSRLGPKKMVNVILVGFSSDQSLSLAKQQEAKWIGGKKNDLVICYSLNNERKAQWAYCFGWSDSALVKRNLETIFISNTVNNNLLPIIESEVVKNWKKRNWHDFDYITIRPSKCYYVALFIVLIVTQSIIWIISFSNNMDRNGSF